MLACFRPCRASETSAPKRRPATPASRSIDTSSQLASLRSLLSDNKIDCYLIPSNDAHGSEYVAPKDRRQKFLSGFSGEASTAVVAVNEARLFVDGRYHIQAAKEIDENWSLMKVGLPGVPTWLDFLKVR